MCDTWMNYISWRWCDHHRLYAACLLNINQLNATNAELRHVRRCCCHEAVEENTSRDSHDSVLCNLMAVLHTFACYWRGDAERLHANRICAAAGTNSSAFRRRCARSGFTCAIRPHANGNMLSSRLVPKSYIETHYCY